ncbi:MAG: protein kinase family protein, partial [Planctomycetota bacterium]
MKEMQVIGDNTENRITSVVTFDENSVLFEIEGPKAEGKGKGKKNQPVGYALTVDTEGNITKYAVNRDSTANEVRTMVMQKLNKNGHRTKNKITWEITEPETIEDALDDDEEERESIDQARADRISAIRSALEILNNKKYADVSWKRTNDAQNGDNPYTHLNALLMTVGRYSIEADTTLKYIENYLRAVAQGLINGLNAKRNEKKPYEDATLELANLTDTESLKDVYERINTAKTELDKKVYAKKGVFGREAGIKSVGFLELGFDEVKHYDCVFGVFDADDILAELDSGPASLEDSQSPASEVQKITTQEKIEISVKDRKADEEARSAGTYRPQNARSKSRSAGRTIKKKKKELVFEKKEFYLPTKRTEITNNEGWNGNFKKYKNLKFQTDKNNELTLGTGTYGDVVLAFDADGNPVACKKIKKMQGVSRAKAHEELNALYQIRELDNNAKLLGVATAGIEDGYEMYIFLELLNGDLGSRKEEYRQLSASQKIENAKNIAQAFNALHVAGVASRDVKLQNIGVTTEGKIKLFDFGEAYVGNVQTVDKQNAKQRSPQMTIVGSPGLNMTPDSWEGTADPFLLDVFGYGTLIIDLFFDRKALNKILGISEANQDYKKFGTLLDNALISLKNENDSGYELTEGSMEPNKVTTAGSIREGRDEAKEAEEAEEAEQTPGTFVVKQGVGAGVGFNPEG